MLLGFLLLLVLSFGRHDRCRNRVRHIKGTHERPQHLVHGATQRAVAFEPGLLATASPATAPLLDLQDASRHIDLEAGRIPAVARPIDLDEQSRPGVLHRDDELARCDERTCPPLQATFTGVLDLVWPVVQQSVLLLVECGKQPLVHRVSVEQLNVPPTLPGLQQNVQLSDLTAGSAAAERGASERFALRELDRGGAVHPR